MKIYIYSFLMFLLSGVSQAAVQTQSISYRDGDVELKGHIYWDDAFEGKRPGIMVVHEWWGLNDYAKHRAEMLAEIGYVAFAADMYGDKKVTRHAAEAGGWKKQITANTVAWQRRAQLGLVELKKHELVDEANLAAIGYCFGGSTVMQMAYAGLDLKGVVSFHGSLPPATDEQAANIKAKVLVAHGDSDGFIPEDRIKAFKAALTKANVDWQMDVYGGAKHGFTNAGAGDYGLDALAYNEAADKRSWQKMRFFFDELFGN